MPLSSEDMRLFIAIEIPEEIKQEMAKIQRLLKGSGVQASWTRAEGIHLTLKFLGEVPESRLPEITTALNNAAGSTAAFGLEVAGVGTFPNPKNARVVWIGISGETGCLGKLHASVEEAMNGLGFEQEERSFTPHLTLGRIRSIPSRDQWSRALDAVKDTRFPAFTVTAISLMKSELKPSGAVYTELGWVELKKDY